MTKDAHSTARFVAEAMSMTSAEIETAQAQHYGMDDMFRRMMGKMTLEQKSKCMDFMMKLLNNNS